MRITGGGYEMGSRTAQGLVQTITITGFGEF